MFVARTSIGDMLWENTVARIADAAFTLQRGTVLNDKKGVEGVVAREVFSAGVCEIVLLPALFQCQDLQVRVWLVEVLALLLFSGKELGLL